MILSNKIHCNTCNTTIESKYVHDFVECGCAFGGAPSEANNTWCAVDGGTDYLERSFGVASDFTDLSTFTEGDTQ